ncbi:uroporphyrinogen-III C-methyltransferase [Vibrio viridaestus]|nr:uroporphyrinogen-III C-methyltransferase [Vibrio viridaestus]
MIFPHELSDIHLGLAHKPSCSGFVSLVGTGPGKIDLLTLKAYELIKTSDIILYDKLVSDEIIGLISHRTKKIFVGKSKGKHSFIQKDINSMLVKLAYEGKTVVRLKGGDPFIFGRGGEEMLHLRKHKVPYQIIPGVTAASGCSASAEIPLTHRGLANSVQFVTGRVESGINKLSSFNQNNDSKTLVFYMGVDECEYISSALIYQGFSNNTPTAIIERGTCEDEKIIITDLLNLPSCVSYHKPKSPSLVIIGKVVSLHSSKKENIDMQSYSDL